MKFPVIRAFLATIAYLTSHVLVIARILWLPTLLMMAGFVYLMPSMIEAQLEIAAMGESADPAEAFSAIGPMLRSMGLLYLGMAILYPMMLAGVLRHVVRGESPSLPFYLQFAGDELRILGAMALLVIMFFMVYLVGVLGVFALAAGLSAVSPTTGAVATLFLFFVFLGALIWFVTRLSVVFAAGVDARSLGIAESWRATNGNFLGLFGYWLSWVVVMFIISCLYMAFAMSGYFAVLMEMFGAAADPAALQEIEQRLLETQRDMWDPSKPAFWPFIIVTYVYTMFYTAAWAAGGGVAYRYLTDGK